MHPEQVSLTSGGATWLRELTPGCRQIHGRLDQIQGLMVLQQAQDTQRFESLKDWTEQLEKLQKSMTDKIR